MNNEKEKKNNKSVSNVLMFAGAFIIILCAYSYYQDADSLLTDALFGFLGLSIVIIGYLFKNLTPLFDGNIKEIDSEKDD